MNENNNEKESFAPKPKEEIISPELTEETTTTVKPTSTPSPAPSKKNKNTGLLIGIVIIILILAGVGIFLSQNKKDDDKDKKETKTEQKGENKEEKKEEKPSIDIEKATGIYRLDENELKIYILKSGKVKYQFQNEKTSASGYAELKGNTATYDSFGKTTFTFAENEVKLESTTEGLVSGTYARQGNYSEYAFYEDQYGDPNFISSQYNGKFEKDGVSLYMYQRDEGEVRVVVEGKTSSYDVEFEIKEEGLLEYSMFDKTSTIKFENETIVFNSTDEDDTDLNGTYTKKDSLTMTDIFENID